MTNHYELLYIVPANYTEDELGPLKETVKTLITKAGGTITLEDNLGKKKLVYPIKKAHNGYYLLYEFDLDGKALLKLNTDLKLTSEILRHLIVKQSAFAPNMIELTKENAKKEEREAQKKPKEKKKEEKVDSRIKLEELDKKLDEILDSDIEL